MRCMLYGGVYFVVIHFELHRFQINFLEFAKCLPWGREWRVLYCSIYTLLYNGEYIKTFSHLLGWSGRMNARPTTVLYTVYRFCRAATWWQNWYKCTPIYMHKMKNKMYTRHAWIEKKNHLHIHVTHALHTYTIRTAMFVRGVLVAFGGGGQFCSAAWFLNNSERRTKKTAKRLPIFELANYY